MSEDPNLLNLNTPLIPNGEKIEYDERKGNSSSGYSGSLGVSINKLIFFSNSQAAFSLYRRK